MVINMADATTDVLSGGLQFLRLDFGLMMIALMVLVLGAVSFIVINNRYPRVNFITSVEGERSWRKRVFRLNQGKVVSDNVMEVFFNGDMQFGENIKRFEEICLDGKWFYIAILTGATLVPMKFLGKEGGYSFEYEENVTLEDGTTQKVKKAGRVQTPFVLACEEVRVQRQIAEDFIQMQQSNKTITEANKTLMMNLLIAAPAALVIISALVTFYIVTKPLIDGMTTIVAPMKEAITQLHDTSMVLQNMTGENGTALTGIGKRYIAPSGGG